jgi:hypothetical protein
MSISRSNRYRTSRAEQGSRACLLTIRSAYWKTSSRTSPGSRGTWPASDEPVDILTDPLQVPSDRVPDLVLEKGGAGGHPGCDLGYGVRGESAARLALAL